MSADGRCFFTVYPMAFTMQHKNPAPEADFFNQTLCISIQFREAAGINHFQPMVYASDSGKHLFIQCKISCLVRRCVQVVITKTAPPPGTAVSSEHYNLAGIFLSNHGVPLQRRHVFLFHGYSPFINKKTDTRCVSIQITGSKQGCHFPSFVYRQDGHELSF